ncbi:MAG: hypothetical protein RQ741_02795 [Wenzhouxiangellaceae bacterium]|nr:hypothetical protein [Wenzhouxiangellaceae bacterium]
MSVPSIEIDGPMVATPPVRGAGALGAGAAERALEVAASSASLDLREWASWSW